MASYVLTVNGTVVASSGSPLDTATLVSFTRNYDDPAELVFRVQGDFRNAPYPVDAVVQLTLDGATVFDGYTYVPRPVYSAGEYPAVEYTAYDRSRALRGPSAENSNGYPEISLPGGTLASVANAYFALAADLLRSVNVSEIPLFTGDAGDVTCFPVSINGETVDEAIRNIAAAAPGVRVFMAPPVSQGQRCHYQFVRLVRSPLADVVIDQRRVQSLIIQPRIERRCGAVKTLGGQTQASADVETHEDVELFPAWDPANQPAWTRREAYQLKPDNTFANPELAIVYRRYGWIAEGVTKDRIRSAMIRIVDEPNPLDALWQERAIESIDEESQTVLLRRPAIAPYHTRNRLAFMNPNLRGRAVGVPAKLRVALAGSASTPIYITSYRVPASGFAGRAYQLAPFTCGYEQKISVPAGVNHEQYARDAFEALSEPTVVGSVPFNEHLPAEFWLLNRRINLRTQNNGATGYENLEAPLLGVSQTWAAGGTSSLDFDRDDTVTLAGGAR